MREPKWDALLDGDPAQVERGIDEWVDAARKRADQMRDVRTRVDQISITHTSENGAVTVTVDANGVLSDIRFGQRVLSTQAAELGPLVMTCIRAAQSRIARQVDEVTAAVVGDDLSDTRRMMVDSYRERFGDNEPQDRPDPARRQRFWSDDNADQNDLRDPINPWS